jgi:Zn-dependent protease with chaperone function
MLNGQINTFKKIGRIAVVSIAALALSSTVAAGTVLKGKSVKKSPYYTGQASSKALEEFDLHSWMDYRKGDDEPKHILDNGFLVDDKAVVQPLYEIAHKLLDQWPGDKPPLSIFVKVGQSASVYGGETLIGNEILIARGTLVNATSDDELAGVLAHEISHVLLGHNKRNKNILAAEKVFDYYGSAKTFKEMLDGTSVKKDGSGEYELEIHDDFVDGLLQASAQRRRASVVYQAYHSSFFSRGAEIDADLLAADLMAEAGYSLMGLQHSLERLSSSYEVEKLINQTLTVSAKSLVNESKKQFLDQMASYDQNGEFGNVDAAFDSMSDSLVSTFKAQAKSAVIGIFKNAHPVPNKRLAKLANYMQDNYRGKVSRRKAKVDLIRVYRRGEVSSLLEHYAQAEQAAELLGEDDLGAAAALASNGISGRASNAPYTRYAAYLVRSHQQDPRRASINATRIGSYLHVPSSKLAEMTRDMARQGYATQANKAIKAKEQYMGIIPDFYPTKIEIALKKKDEEQATTLARDCLATKKIKAELKDACLGYDLLAAQSGKTSSGLFGVLQSTVDSVNDLSKGIKGDN